MQIQTTALPGVTVITPARHGDSRGFFSESWNRRSLDAAGLHLPDFVQDNHSVSRHAGTLRGLHFQAPPHAQAKLVRCGRGRCWMWRSISAGQPDLRAMGRRRAELRERAPAVDSRGLPARLRHARADTEIIYKCTDYYAPDCDGAVRLDDPHRHRLGAERTTPILSDKDAAAPSLRRFSSALHLWRRA